MDSLVYTTETASLSDVKFIDYYDDVFLTQVETKSMLKVDLLPLQNFLPVFTPSADFFFPVINIEGEQKISKSLSLNLGLRPSFFYRNIKEQNVLVTDTMVTIGEPLPFVKASKKDFDLGMALRVEPRYYFTMSNRIKKGLNANNLSGVYIAPSYTFYVKRTASARINDSFPKISGTAVSHRVGLNLGLQRRIFERGFIDLYFGYAYSWGNNVFVPFPTTRDPSEYEVFKRFFEFDAISSGVKLGWAIGSVGDAYDPNKCEVLKCYQEVNGVFKLNLLYAARVIDNNLSGELSLAYEKRLGNSSISLNTELFVFYGGSVNGNILFLEPYLRGNLDLTPRWFYNQNRRIAAGKSGKNLSGDYVGIQSRY